MVRKPSPARLQNQSLTHPHHPELRGGPSLILGLVTEWPIFPGIPEAVENDAAAHDADTTPASAPVAIQCHVFNALSDDGRCKDGICSRPTNARDKHENHYSCMGASPRISKYYSTPLLL